MKKLLRVVGTAALVVGTSFILGPIKQIEPFFTYFYMWAWGPFIWALLRILSQKHPSHPLLVPRTLLSLFPFSVTLWLVFEVLNFRLRNWTYHRLPSELSLRWPGYAVSFSTVAPAVLTLASLLISSRRSEIAATPAKSRTSDHVPALALGVLMIALPMALPVYFFPLVWGFAFFLADPAVERMGGHSLLADWRSGRFSATLSLLISGFICGGYWELCNYWAGAKWMYHIPFVGQLKIFEMPVLGFLGFPVFALEVHALHELCRICWRGLKTKTSKIVLVSLMLVFWLLAFAGIDHWTVKEWRQSRTPAIKTRPRPGAPAIVLA